MPKVTITPYGDGPDVNACYANVDGIIHIGSVAYEQEVAEGTVITCYVGVNGVVMIDDVTVMTGYSSTIHNYAFVIREDTELQIGAVGAKGYVKIYPKPNVITKHYALVDGTDYEISGGDVLVDGTGYEVADGQVLVDGTGHEIDFDNGMRNLAITGTGNKTYTFVKIGSTKYYEATTLEVEVGTVITCQAGNGKSGSSYTKSIYVNGNLVKTGTGSSLTYEYTVRHHATVTLRYNQYGGCVVEITDY
jgi:hypothetical protein